MLFDAHQLARGWLSVALAAAPAKQGPPFGASILIEEHPHGVRLAATDTAVLIDRAPDDEPTDPPVTDDESWRTRAACRGADPALFFPDRGGHVVALEAKAICRQCEVRQQCLDYAIATNQEHGIWGGTSLMERRQIRRARREQVSA